MTEEGAPKARHCFAAHPKMCRAFSAPHLIHSTSPGLTAGPMHCRPFRPGPRVWENSLAGDDLDAGRRDAGGLPSRAPGISCRSDGRTQIRVEEKTLLVSGAKLR